MTVSDALIARFASTCGSARPGSRAPCRSRAAPGSRGWIAALRSCPRPASAGAELVDDDREPLRGRAAAVMLPSRSRSTGEWSAASGSRCSPAPGCPLEAGTAAPRARPLASGVHSTNFSPISDCGRIVQLASSRKARSPADVDLEDDRGLAGRDVTSSAVDLAHLHARDLHVLARDTGRRRCRRSRAPGSRRRAAALAPEPSDDQATSSATSAASRSASRRGVHRRIAVERAAGRRGRVRAVGRRLRWPRPGSARVAGLQAAGRAPGAAGVSGRRPGLRRTE